MSFPCSDNQYFDNSTNTCRSCADCHSERAELIYIRQCQNSYCPADYYYDPITCKCFSCSECRYPRTPHKYCTQCPGEPTATTPPSSEPSIAVVVVIFISVSIVLVVGALILYRCFKKYLRKQQMNVERVVAVPVHEPESVANGCHYAATSYRGEQEPLFHNGHASAGISQPETVVLNVGDGHPSQSLGGGVHQPCEGHQPAESRLSDRFNSSHAQEEAVNSSSMVVSSVFISRQSTPESGTQRRRVSFRAEEDDDIRSDTGVQPADEISAPSLVCPSTINNNHLAR